MEEDLPVEKIQISGPTLASILHRFSASPGDIHGLLFGQVTVSTPSSLSDDHPTTSSSSITTTNSTTPFLTATISSFFSLPSHLPLPLDHPSFPNSNTVIGWFSGRRKTPSRPSLKDSTTASTLSLHPPSLFLLLTTPFHDQIIHTHEYRAFQYSVSGRSFDPKSLDIINIGPSFRSHYQSFSPNSGFPLMQCELRGSSVMAEDEKNETLKDQKELDLCADGFEIKRLSKLMGSDAANYTAELEDLYGKMLAKLDGLARLVEKSSAKVREQENHNMKLRCKVAGLE